MCKQTVYFSRLIRCCPFLLVGLGLITASLSAHAEDSAAEVQWNEDANGWTIEQDGKLFAGYLLDSNGKPIIYPLQSADGRRVVRNFPMLEGTKSERSDHDHHRSMWLTHGDVNGIDFWLDDAHCGKIVQRTGQAATTNDGSVVIQTENDWLAPDGKRLLSDTRRFEFRTLKGRRIIDCDFLLKATDGDVNFGDTKEGSFGMRIAGTMKVDAKLGGKITNAEGLNDKQAWGKKSSWVNYTGPVDGRPAGITIHDHPSSFQHPCRWHVRTYGLFAANPFGVHHFVGGKKTEGVVLKSGESMRLSYRVVIDDAKFDSKQTAADWKAYAKQNRPELK
ncbi:MAG: PmoA family protein [Rubripirellula sp.]